jgi:hypothetical protein
LVPWEERWGGERFTFLSTGEYRKIFPSLGYFPPSLFCGVFLWKFPWCTKKPWEWKRSLSISAPGTDRWDDKHEVTVTSCGCGHKLVGIVTNALV